MALSSLTELDKYKAAPFPPGYPDTTRTFYSPVDQVHLALKEPVDVGQQDASSWRSQVSAARSWLRLCSPR